MIAVAIVLGAIGYLLGWTAKAIRYRYSKRLRYTDYITLIAGRNYNL